jgi:hypothetical protein
MKCVTNVVCCTEEHSAPSSFTAEDTVTIPVIKVNTARVLIMKVKVKVKVKVSL